MKGRTLIVAAGGTGGHITPGISVTEKWLAAGGRVIFATLMKNLEYPDIIRLARFEAVSIVAYDAPRLPKNPLKIFSFLKRFRSATRLISQAAAQEGADAVLGMGGYSSFPAVWFAIFNRRPLFLCEQNARWGIVTRFGRFFARRIFLSFESGQKLSAKFVVTGNPLRSMFKDLPKKRAVKSPKQKIFFLGGSQGAQDINALYLAFVQNPAARKYHCIVAAGHAASAELTAKGRKGDEILPFIEDMPSVYRSVDMVVARCGSGTLFEILWSGAPAFLIPYPFAAANHQRANADAMLSQMPCAMKNTMTF